MNSDDLIIIGTGPAGLTAAIYAARADLNPLVIEGYQPGGQLTTTTEVDNFPGFPQGIAGPELMERMRQQAARFGSRFVTAEVTEVNLQEKPFAIKTADNQVFHSKTVIISTGATARYLGLPHEQELIGRGVSACATCDGFFFRNKIIHVVGGGDTALEEATFLTKFASKVYIVHRRDALRGSKAMADKAFKDPKIDFVWDSVVTEILANENGVNGIVVENVKTGNRDKRATDGLFLAIGHVPNTKFLGNQITLNENGFIKTNNETETNIPGVFACGDVQDPTYRQAITAAGTGCMAALKAQHFLSTYA